MGVMERDASMPKHHYYHDAILYSSPAPKTALGGKKKQRACSKAVGGFIGSRESHAYQFIVYWLSAQGRLQGWSPCRRQTHSFQRLGCGRGTVVWMVCSPSPSLSRTNHACDLASLLFFSLPLTVPVPSESLCHSPSEMQAKLTEAAVLVTTGIKIL